MVSQGRPIVSLIQIRFTTGETGCHNMPRTRVVPLHSECSGLPSETNGLSRTSCPPSLKTCTHEFSSSPAWRP